MAVAKACTNAAFGCIPHRLPGCPTKPCRTRARPPRDPDTHLSAPPETPWLHAAKAGHITARTGGKLRLSGIQPVVTWALPHSLCGLAVCRRRHFPIGDHIRMRDW